MYYSIFLVHLVFQSLSRHPRYKYKASHEKKPSQEKSQFPPDLHLIWHLIWLAMAWLGPLGWLMSSSVQRALEEIRTLSLGTLHCQWSCWLEKIPGVGGCFVMGLILLIQKLDYQKRWPNISLRICRCVGKLSWKQRLNIEKKHVTSLKLTWHWKLSIFNGEYIFKCWSFPARHLGNLCVWWHPGLEVLPVPKQRLPLLDAQAMVLRVGKVATIQCWWTPPAWNGEWICHLWGTACCGRPSFTMP